MRQRRNKMQLADRLPATFRLPMLPKLGADELSADSFGDIPVREWFSKTTNPPDAATNREVAVENCLTRCARGDWRGLEELLELGEEFGRDPRIADAMRDMILAARIGAKRSGRPPGLSRADHERSLLIGRIAEGFRGSGITLERIFAAMDRQNFAQVSDRTRRNYYLRARKHPAMQAQLFTPQDPRTFSPRQWPGASDYVFVPRRIRLELPFALPPGTQLRVNVLRAGNTTTLACELH